MTRMTLVAGQDLGDRGDVWGSLRAEAAAAAASEPMLASFLHSSILNHDGACGRAVLRAWRASVGG